MNLATLYHLLNSFTDEKRRVEAAAQQTDDPARQVELEQRAKAIAIIVAELRGELLSRELPGARSASTAQEFETHLHRVIKTYGSLEPRRGEDIRRTA